VIRGLLPSPKPVSVWHFAVFCENMPVSDSPPLSAQLSAALVAFTIEADNAAEQRLPHKTTEFGAPGGRDAVWLTSLAMWFNCVGPLAGAGELTVRDLEAHARMATNLDGMRRWGYLTIDGIGRVPRKTGGAGRPHAKPNSVLALTERGIQADAVWRTLPEEIEQRWGNRFGAPTVERLRGALLTIAETDPGALPDFMPIAVMHRGALPEPGPRGPGSGAADAGLSLVSLLARVLLRFTLDNDRGARVPVLIWSDLLRVLDPTEPTAVRSLPERAGVSKEALAVLTGALEKAGIVVSEPGGGSGQGKQLRLTLDRGAYARTAGARQLTATTTAWEKRYGNVANTELLEALEPIVGDGTRSGSPLFAGLNPPANGWRAQIKPPQRLPWYPLVLHRGGYPDGS
jgi:hypothetical protein